MTQTKVIVDKIMKPSTWSSVCCLIRWINAFWTKIYCAFASAYWAYIRCSINPLFCYGTSGFCTYFFQVCQFHQDFFMWCVVADFPEYLPRVVPISSSTVLYKRLVACAWLSNLSEKNPTVDKCYINYTLKHVNGPSSAWCRYKIFPAHLAKYTNPHFCFILKYISFRFFEFLWIGIYIRIQLHHYN